MVRPVKGSRPTSIDVAGALRGLRINQGITTAMLPSVSFSPTIGITARRVDKLGMDIRSFHEPLRRSIKEVVAPSIRKNIDEGGRPPWEPFSDATPEIQDRIYNRGDHPLLVRTGTMRRVMGQLNIWTINRDAAILKDVPSKIWYAKIQQAGYKGKGGSKKVGHTTGTLSQALSAIEKKAKAGDSQGQAVSPIPARPFVMLQEEDVAAISIVFDKWLGERIDRTWPRHG